MVKVASDQELLDCWTRVRELSGISVRKAAEIMELSHSTAHRWKTGERRPLEESSRVGAERFIAHVSTMEAVTPRQRAAREVAHEFLERQEKALAEEVSRSRGDPATGDLDAVETDENRSRPGDDDRKTGEG